MWFTMTSPARAHLPVLMAEAYFTRMAMPENVATGIEAGI